MRKPLAIQKCYGRTDGGTDGRINMAKCRVAYISTIKNFLIVGDEIWTLWASYKMSLQLELLGKNGKNQQINKFMNK